MYVLAKDDKNDNYSSQLLDESKQLLEDSTKVRYLNLMGEVADHNNAFLEIHAGAGGTESQDWAEMLRRMYMKWSSNKKFKFQIISEHKGDEAGLKSSTIKIVGDYVFGLLKSESGIHRLVRISPFDSGARRHTSFASVYAYPEVDNTIDIQVNPSDTEWETFRSSGAGGQSVNKIESAVRLKHLPSGIIVECQQERSQLQNKEKAMNMLKSKLYQLEIEKKNKAREAIESSKLQIDFGSQIRNYVLHPYKLVKDLRTNIERNDVSNVLDGDIDAFIKAFLLEKEN